MTHKHRIALVGAGRVADVHYGSLRKLADRVELVGFCENRDDARARRAAEWGLPGYADINQLLETQKPDAVCLLLPHDQHVSTIRAAADRGVHVFLEKPIAASMEQASEIRDIVAQSGITLLVAHNGLFHPAFDDVCQAVQRGWIGRPLFARATSAGWLTFRPWDFRLSVAKTGGGCWIDAGGHLVYCLREILGAVADVTGFTGRLARTEMEGEDHACATLRYQSGALAQLFVSYGHKLPGYESDWPHGYLNQIEIFGDAGAISYTISPQPELRLFSEVPEAMAPQWRGWLSRQPAEPYAHSFYAEMEHFVDCLDGKAKPKVTVDDACEVLRVLLALYNVAPGKPQPEQHMIIKRVEPFILYVPVTGNTISDSTHTISHWGVVGTRIVTDNGLTGYGYTGTHAFLPGDRLITNCIKDCYAPLLIGRDASESEAIWHTLNHHPALQWIGRQGITQLALAAVDVALWDLKAKQQEIPLWALLGGATIDKLPAYNTDIGWLSIPMDKLVAGCRQAVEEQGFAMLKIKVGSANPGDDLTRLEAVRRAIGEKIHLAIDGNGRWDLPTCQRFCARAAAFDVFWIEEPLWYDDVTGHAALARSTPIPIALGEQLYTQDAFAAFIDAGAVHYVQPDVTRLGGVTEFLRVADAAHIRRLPIAPHVGDMGQVHVHLAYNHPACHMLEYIPWIAHAFEEPIAVRDGVYQRPTRPGAGTTLTAGAMTRFAQPL